MTISSRGSEHNKAIEQKAALYLIRQHQSLHEQGTGCALYGRATLGTLQLMASVMLIQELGLVRSLFAEDVARNYSGANHGRGSCLIVQITMGQRVEYRSPPAT